MKCLNSVSLLGALATDPVMNYINGKTVTKFTVATSRQYKLDDDVIEETTMHQVVARGSLAEAAGKLAKGAVVFIEGRLSYQGQKLAAEIISDNIIALVKPARSKLVTKALEFSAKRVSA